MTCTLDIARMPLGSTQQAALLYLRVPNTLHVVCGFFGCFFKSLIITNFPLRAWKESRRRSLGGLEEASAVGP